MAAVREAAVQFRLLLRFLLYRPLPLLLPLLLRRLRRRAGAFLFVGKTAAADSRWIRKNSLFLPRPAFPGRWDTTTPFALI